VASVLAAGGRSSTSAVPPGGFASPPPAASVAAASSTYVPPVVVAEEQIRLVDGDIPASSLGAFISRGIQVTLESTRTGSSASEARGSNAGGDYLKKELHALKYAGHSFSLMTYAPRTFEQLRQNYGITNASFVESLVKVPPRGGSVGDGKSGMLFYFSVDNKFVLKTVKKEELHFFRYMLDKYTNHMCEQQRHSLLPRFFALVKIKYHLRNPDGSAGAEKTFRLVVMNNLFDVPKSIHIQHRFDLKGSTRNRYIPPDKAVPGRVLLDLNWSEQGMKLHLGPQQKALFIAQVKADAAFLRAVDVMDHSLLLGVAEDSDASFEEVSHKTELDPGMSVDARALANPLQLDRTHPNSGGLASAWQVHRGGVRAFDAGVGGPGARGPSTPRREIYYFGIIDILQKFDTKKKLESAYKSIRFNKASISAIESKGYNERFIAYLDQISC
jgi:1-phosphatidylinositol-4-phosphate 5-kinase